jgi:hypothetical protein
MYTSVAYGLLISSEFGLLNTSVSVSTVDRPDVEVRLGSLKELWPPKCNSSNKLLGVLPSIGKILIREGQEIVIDPDPGVDETLLRPSILGTAMSVLLQQRGFLVLHASAVVIAGKAVAFMGYSGAGKSTTASAFVNQGYALVTDDVLAVRFDQGYPEVVPSYPTIKLLPDAVEALGHQIDELPLLNRLTSKRIQQVESVPLKASYPLHKIYILALGDCHEIHNVSPVETLFTLINHSRAVNTLIDTPGKKLHFQQCSEMVQSLPVALLKRKGGLTELSEIVKLVEADLLL